jgi:hypothetical protein
MRALTPLMQAYVTAMLDHPMGNQSMWAEMAGYSNTSANYLRKTGHNLAHDPRIQAAIQEEARKRINSGTIMAVSALMDLVRNPEHKDHFKAVSALLNRVGFHEKTESLTVVEHRGDDQAAIQKIKDLAQLLGVDAKVLLGKAGVVEAEFTDVTPATDLGWAGLEDLF